MKWLLIIVLLCIYAMLLVFCARNNALIGAIPATIVCFSIIMDVATQ